MSKDVSFGPLFQYVIWANFLQLDIRIMILKFTNGVSVGGILLATTNVPEVSLWWETENRLYGSTNNPYNCKRTPGGSSGGEVS